MYICRLIMKHFLTILISAVILFTACNTSENNSDVASVMKDSTKFTTIKWQDSVISFGRRKMGEVINITFHCTNTGNKLLYLFDVRPGCGCTLVDYTKTPIQPGGQGIIEAKFDTKKSHPGIVHKSVHVSANASNSKLPYLRFSGVILPADSSETK